VQQKQNPTTLALDASITAVRPSPFAPGPLRDYGCTAPRVSERARRARSCCSNPSFFVVSSTHHGSLPCGRAAASRSPSSKEHAANAFRDACPCRPTTCGSDFKRARSQTLSTRRRADSLGAGCGEGYWPDGLVGAVASGLSATAISRSCNQSRKENGPNSSGPLRLRTESRTLLIRDALVCMFVRPKKNQKQKKTKNTKKKKQEKTTRKRGKRK